MPVFLSSLPISASCLRAFIHSVSNSFSPYIKLHYHSPNQWCQTPKNVHWFFHFSQLSHVIHHLFLENHLLIIMSQYDILSTSTIILGSGQQCLSSNFENLDSCSTFTPNSQLSSNLFFIQSQIVWWKKAS